MAGVSTEAIYKELTAQGASTIQAIGIMANMYFESGFNPEAVGDQGTSFGLVQQHGAYSHLVTGDAQSDMVNQIKTMVSLGGLGAASGSSPTQAASNFAANYERCVGCQAGGSQNASRTAFASTVAGWASSGKWPASAGSPSSGPGAGGTPTATLDSSNPLGWAFGESNAEFGWFGKLITGIVGTPSSIGDVATSISGLVQGLTKFLQLFLLLFRPEFWLRVGAFFVGLITLGAAVYFLKNAL